MDRVRRRGVIPIVSTMPDRARSEDQQMVSLRLAAISFILLGAIACSDNATSPSPTAPPPSSNGSAASVVIPRGAESLGNRAFNPDDVSVAVGATVTWTNTDSEAHTSTSDRAGWDSGVVQPGATFSATFPTAGTFTYHCTLHPGLVGTIVVQ
jgi:plastocyanin